MRMRMHALYVSAVLATTFLAAMHAFSNCNVLDSAWARLVVIVGVFGGFVLASSSSTFVPTEGPTFLPSTLLKKTIPAGAVTALELTDIPRDATHVAYWAAPPELDPKLDNAGLVEVVGGRATLRMHCPRAVNGKPRHVQYRFVSGTGDLSSTKTAFVKC